MKKIVLSGGPSCGKTTMVNELKKEGYPIIEEVARKILSKKEINKENRNELLKLQYQIGIKQIEEEAKSEKLYHNKPLVFQDRSLIDAIAYYKVFLNFLHLHIEEDNIMRNRYHQVFILDRLPFKKDGVRIEKNDREAQRLHKEIILAYKLCGYNPIIVPVLPIKRRLEYILDHIQMKGGN